MKSKKIFKIVSGILSGIAPVLLASILGLSLYSSYPNYFSVGIGILLFLLSIWLGISIFKRIQVVGFVEFITAVSASPDLDTLKLSKNSRTKQRTPHDYSLLVHQNNHLLKRGSMRIYGDWFGEPYEKTHLITHCQFKQEEEVLTIQFSKGEQIEIHYPDIILEAPSFFKIVHAKCIRLSFPNQKNKTTDRLFILYKREKRFIKTTTNLPKGTHSFHVSTGAPALVIYGLYDG